jgi:hypothetical protein
MQRRQFLLVTLKHTLFGTTACSLSACGTLLHPERVGRPHSRDIDWKIAAMDGLGLLLFFVPGVIAFVVDFSTGAIYFPADGMSAIIPSSDVSQEAGSRTEDWSSNGSIESFTGQQQTPLTWKALPLKRVELPRQQMQQRDIEEIVASQVGREISLDQTNVRLSELSDIDQFDEQLERHRNDHNFGHAARSFFSRLPLS